MGIKNLVAWSTSYLSALLAENDLRELSVYLASSPVESRQDKVKDREHEEMSIIIRVNVAPGRVLHVSRRFDIFSVKQARNDVSYLTAMLASVVDQLNRNIVEHTLANS